MQALTSQTATMNYQGKTIYLLEIRSRKWGSLALYKALGNCLEKTRDTVNYTVHKIGASCYDFRDVFLW